MKLIRTDFYSFFLILIISLFFVLELFSFPGIPVGFDSIAHISTIAQFSKIIGHGEIPVIWMNNFANYGIPIGIIVHQIPNYLGGLITLITNDPITSYNIVVFIAIFLSNVFLYLFLRFYFSPLSSFLGIFIFNFTPYRIFNIYVRGAMPEVFASIFLPLILMAMYIFIAKKKFYAFFLLILFIAGLTLSHPMMLVIYSSFFIPYLIFLILTTDFPKISKIKMFIASIFAILLGVLTCSYYILPLNVEFKYFYFGLEKSHLKIDSYLNLVNFLSYQWPYFTNTEVFPRGHIVLFGLLETLILITGFFYVLYKKLIQKSKENLKILYFVLIIAGLLILITCPISTILFQKLFFLNSIQFQWRFLSSLIFLPPIIVAFLYDRFPKKIIFFLLVIIVACFSFPQIYGKNFMLHPKQSFYFAAENAHSVIMNTIWSGKSEDYPIKTIQAKVIDGIGRIENQNLSNSKRIYKIDAKTALRLVDYTFYFPGWNVYIDNVKTNIQFQDPNYRGIITYNVPIGKHLVVVSFEDTKVRLLGKIITVVALIVFIIIFIIRKRLSKYIIYNNK